MPFRLSAVSEVVADRMSTGDRIIEEGEAIIIVPASAPQPCVLEACGKEQTGIGPWGYPLNTEAQGKGRIGIESMDSELQSSAASIADLPSTTAPLKLARTGC